MIGTQSCHNYGDFCFHINSTTINVVHSFHFGSLPLPAGLVLQFLVFLFFVIVSLIVLRKPEVRAGGALVRKVVGICLATIFTLLVRNGYR